MQSWEIVVIILGAAIVALCIYLITVIKKMNLAVTQLNELVETNKSSINNILTNADAITGDVSSICNNAKVVVGNLTGTINAHLPASSGSAPEKEGSVSAPQLLSPERMKTAVAVISAAISGYKVIKKVSDNARTKKLLREAKKVNKAMKNKA